jgi:hypothetical protein
MKEITESQNQLSLIYLNGQEESDPLVVAGL